MITYLQSQKNRMSHSQIELVERLEKISPDGWLREERERATKLYIWLHMDNESVAHRTFERKKMNFKRKGVKYAKRK